MNVFFLDFSYLKRTMNKYDILELCQLENMMEILIVSNNLCIITQLLEGEDR